MGEHVIYLGKFFNGVIHSDSVWWFTYLIMSFKKKKKEVNLATFHYRRLPIYIRSFLLFFLVFIAMAYVSNLSQDYLSRFIETTP